MNARRAQSPSLARGQIVCVIDKKRETGDDPENQAADDSVDVTNAATPMRRLDQEESGRRPRRAEPMLRIDGKTTGAWVAGVRTSIVTRDGTLWAESDEWPTIARMTEDGKMTRYALPCADKRLSLVPGPQNGIWFRSPEPNCSGYIDAAAITLREFPYVEIIDSH
jgi:hypothetical protein